MPGSCAQTSHEQPSGGALATELGKEAAVLSAVEVGIGSVLHAFAVPMAGHLLSLNQGFLMARAALSARARFGAQARLFPLHLSVVAAVLKSLAPAGKKLTPMLAISAQGALFSVGTLVFGANALGVVVGSVLSSVWAFAQPLLIYYLIFGKSLFEALAGLYAKLTQAFSFAPEHGLWVLLALVVFKGVLALGLAVGALVFPEASIRAYRDRLLCEGHKKMNRRDCAVARDMAWGAGGGFGPPAGRPNPWGKSAALALRDLLNPLFVASMALTLGFFAWVEGPSSKLVWLGLRPVAVGFIVFFLLRVLPVERLAEGLIRVGLSGTGRSLQVALEAIRKL